MQGLSRCVSVCVQKCRTSVGVLACAYRNAGPQSVCKRVRTEMQGLSRCVSVCAQKCMASVGVCACAHRNAWPQSV
ncbi:hypothetical protein DPMN_172754 [Dreissena polymorpha]|uniref:Uncharacterized protein n=1 Tax=Dreissena polymorpha TaxID=45954 RepID=A0A9D4E3S7_DREPO|nr:hypothetical protein DPMN_172754 [Dreissena polymorpha]